MDIAEFREILFWPFMLDDKKDKTFLQIVEEGNWKKQDCLFKRNYLGQARPQKTAYGEFLYFQPYVQRFLFGQGIGDKQIPTQAWQRTDINEVTATLAQFSWQLEQPPVTVNCHVEQLWLFRFRLGTNHSVAMLCLELKANNALPLSACQDFLDQFRRVYPPYWESHGVERIPTHITWHSNEGSDRSFNIGSHEAYYQQLANKLRPPLAKHWAWLLCGHEDSELLDKLRHIEDERMPSMAYLALPDPRKLQRGDFVRLCFADARGDSATLPYTNAFLANFESDYCYDRYWSTSRDHDQDWMSTRIMNCGYAFSLIGQYSPGSEEKDPGFFSNGETGALSHFRNHYFLMGLIAHFQKAALLSFYDKLSTAVTGKNDKTLSRSAKSTLREIIDFSDRYWFIDLSTQVQAQELYAQWRKHLKLDELYQQVTEEARMLSDYLENEATKREANMVNILTWAGVIFAIISACATFGLTEILKAQNISHWLQLKVSSGLGLLMILAVFIFSRRR